MNDGGDGDVDGDVAAAAGVVGADNHGDFAQPEDVERVTTELAEEISNLSIQQREKSLLDVHGIADSIDETPEFVNSRLQDLDTALMREVEAPANSSNNAFLNAMRIDKEYVTRPSFLLMFLRASLFDVQKTCAQIISFFHHKNELFTETKLCKDITQNDLTAADRACLSNGHLQLLPVRSTGLAGRAVLVYTPRLLKFEQHENALRTLFYVVMAAAVDEATQRSGALSIVYSIKAESEEGSGSLPPPMLSLRAVKLRGALPLRQAANHVCVDSTNFRGFFTVLSKALNQQARIRTRIHHGSRQEVKYSLLTFGVPVDSLPINNDGELKRDKHKVFIRMMKNLEDRTRRTQQHNDSQSSLPPSKPLIILPTRDDVLFGRGKSFQQFHGNVRLGLVVESRVLEYKEKINREKTAMARDLVNEMKLLGCRFLRQVDLVWEEADDEMAREKVSNTFRSTWVRIEDKGRYTTTSPRRTSDVSIVAATASHKRER